jgi:predicted flap endonuclease-1-like 5' DNA nuclease
VEGLSRGEQAPATEFPRSIGKVAARELAGAGYTRFQQLTKVSRNSLLAIHGVGPKSVNILEEELKKRGLGFSSS